MKNEWDYFWGLKDAENWGLEGLERIGEAQSILKITTQRECRVILRWLVFLTKE